MRILFITNLYPPIFLGGYELICFDIAQRLQARGHHVHVLTSQFRAREVPEHEHGVRRQLKLKRNWGDTNGGPAPWLARNRVALDWHNCRVARAAVAETRPEVVLVWNGGNMGRAVLSTIERASRVVYYLHDPWLAPVLATQRRGGRAALRTLIYSLLRPLGIPSTVVRNDYLVFCSRDLRQRYEHMGVEVSRSPVIYNGVDSGTFPFRTQHIARRVPGEPFRILYAGQLMPEKGVDTLVTALARLRTMPGLEHTRLTLMGAALSDDYMAHLRSWASDLGVADSVEHLPRRARAEIPDVFAAHDVLAFTSQWPESFPLTILEAMATGLPVVSSLTGGQGEIVRDGDNAMAFQAGDPSDLADKLAWLFLHPQEAARLGARAARQVHARYTLDHQADQIERYLCGIAA